MTMSSIRQSFLRAAQRQVRVAELGHPILRLILGFALALDLAAGHPLWLTVGIVAAIVAVFWRGARRCGCRQCCLGWRRNCRCRAHWGCARHGRTRSTLGTRGGVPGRGSAPRRGRREERTVRSQQTLAAGAAPCGSGTPWTAT